MWTTAAMKGIGPAVMGILGVKLGQMAPHALPDVSAVAILIASVIILMMSRLGAVKIMIAGSVFGVLRSRFFCWQERGGFCIVFGVECNLNSGMS